MSSYLEKTKSEMLIKIDKTGVSNRVLHVRLMIKLAGVMIPRKTSSGLEQHEFKSFFKASAVTIPLNVHSVCVSTSLNANCFAAD